MTINQLIRQRRDAVKLLQRAVRPVDTQVEKYRRKCESLLRRQNKVPEEQDFVDLVDIQREIDKKLEDLLAAMRGVSVIFS